MLYDKRSGAHFTTTGGWWPCEVIALKSMMRDEYSYLKMAHVLSREYEAIRKKVKYLIKKELEE